MLPKNASLRHVALYVNNIDACEKFYNMLGMQTELKTGDYCYLAGNSDNISLHKISTKFAGEQRLEHIGFALDSVDSVNKLYEQLCDLNINILQPPKTFGIGTHAFSVLDPDGIEVEFIYHPSMWRQSID